jgi:acyl-coenzyme A synthetase/AMP-(fatty) acid ligase
MDVPVPGDAAPDLFAGRLLQAASFWELITKRAQASGQQVMLLDEHDRRVSFAGFRDRAERVGAALYEIGIGPGTRVAWQLPTRISTALVMAALARLGAAQAPIIPIYGQRATAAAVESAGAEVILVPGSWRGTDYAEMARGLRSAPRVVVVGEHAPEADAPGSLPRPLEAEWIYFTSGSSGLPKGARHARATLWSSRSRSTQRIESNVSQASHGSRIERGAGNPTEATLQRLASALQKRLELVAVPTAA